eukprot:189186-Rhodomonas_salina.1
MESESEREVIERESEKARARRWRDDSVCRSLSLARSLARSLALSLSACRSVCLSVCLSVCTAQPARERV